MKNNKNKKTTTHIWYIILRVEAAGPYKKVKTSYLVFSMTIIQAITLALIFHLQGLKKFLIQSTAQSIFSRLNPGSSTVQLTRSLTNTLGVQSPHAGVRFHLTRPSHGPNGSGSLIVLTLLRFTMT